VLVEEKIRREIREEVPLPQPRALPGAPNELRVVEDVVSSSGLKSLETSGLLRLGCSETLHIRVTESNQGGGGAMVRRPLELGEYGGDGCGSRKIGGVLQQPKACGGGDVLRNGGGEKRIVPPECAVGKRHWVFGVGRVSVGRDLGVVPPAKILNARPMELVRRPCLSAVRSGVAI
jgi:hypothetical protein